MCAQLIKALKEYDESLNLAHSKSYKLSIQLSLDGFVFTLFNSLNSKFLSLESAEMSHSENPADFLRAFNELVEKHPWLGAEFESINLYFEASKSTLIPAPLYNPEDQELLAKFNFEVSQGMEIRHDWLPNADAYLIYAIPKDLLALLGHLFPGYKLSCHASALIEVLMIMNKNLPASKRLFVNVRNGQLDVVITEGKHLLFYNAFPYHSKQDFIYYIIYVIEQLNLNPEEIELKLSGSIDKQSTLYDLAWKYIRNIQFQELSSAYRYSYLFNDIPSHSYFTLINSGLCEL